MSAELFRDSWRYRELLYFLTWRDLKIRYKQTAFGVVWAVVQPLLTMIVFTVLFGNLGRLPSDGSPYPLFYLSALLPWTYFSSTLPLSANSLISNSSLLTKIYFPRIILPASATLGGLPDFLVGSSLLAAMMVYYQIRPGWSWLIWPLLVFLLAAFTLAVGMILAALNVKYRDVKYVLPFVIQLWLFVTPVIYPANLVPKRFRPLMALNPLSGIVEAFRGLLLPSSLIDWQLLATSAMITVAIFVVGLVYFSRTEHMFADIV
ncbi:MAG: ABC transporter permease [Acidobacteria bacterium]|nr:ABC transporter permease [Acidobacteriota bacterium]MCI0718395.1 ABC transporter permease [Acidobacteriota bacterium]